MHKNPVSKRWQLANDFTDYRHSNASFYEKGIMNYDKLLHVNRSVDVAYIPGSAHLLLLICKGIPGKTPGGLKFMKVIGQTPGYDIVD